MKGVPALGLGIFLLVSALWVPQAYPGEPSPIAARAAAPDTVLELVGNESCLACHDGVESALAAGPHGSPAFAERSELGCETCHGPGSAHMDDPEAPYGDSPGYGQLSSAACRSCHAGEHSRFPTNAHARAGMSCVDCHSIHGETEWSPLHSDASEPFETARITGSSASCVTCHTDVAGEFEFNERHRLQEGIMSCADCHDPHGPSTRTHLAGFKQESCVECHADKGGPFVFEHGSVRVEGCAACHTPHGSPNRHMLTHERVAELCYSCHVEVPGFHIRGGRFGLDTQCTNCHATIHGSNFSPVFFK